MIAQVDNSLMNNYEKKVLSFFYAFSLYLPSTALLPAQLYYFLALAVFFYKVSKREWSTEEVFIYLFLFLSLSVSLIAYFFQGGNLEFKGNFIPLQLSLLCSLIIATKINRYVATYLVAFILFECFAGYLQLFLGVKTFFPFVNVVISEVGESAGLLYYMRVFGFNENSSGFAGNVLIMITLTAVYMRNCAFKVRTFVFFCAFFALVVSFSRSGLIAYFLFVVLFILYNLRAKHLKIVLPASILTCLALMFFVDWDVVFNQFSRGRSNVELSGRDLIWGYYFNAIDQALFFGNFSLRNFLYIPHHGYQHAHSSYIMLIYLLGAAPLLLISFPLLVLGVLKFKRSIFLIALVVYSAAQYYLFWGASLADIVLFALLISKAENGKVFVRQEKV